MDILALWNFQNPAESEERFREAIPRASEEEQFILTTQIARTYGLRKDFETARSILAGIADQVIPATESKARYHLELGRTYCSPVHNASELTTEAKEKARKEYTEAFETARDAGLDYLAIDALHMMTVVDPEPQDQIEWNLKAIEYMNQSSQPEARKWEGSLRNNLGYALALAGRYDEALEEFELSLKARLAAENRQGAQIAKWMIGWTQRLKGDLQEALATQLKLERELDSIEESDPFVYEELETIFLAVGDEARASFYRDKRSTTNS